MEGVVQSILSKLHCRKIKVLQHHGNTVIMTIRDSQGAKKVLKITDGIPQFETERNALKHLKSPFTPRLLRSFRHGRYGAIVMEYIPGKKLSDYRDKSMPISWWNGIIHQILLYAKFLEDQKILHNDLWDDNIIVSASGRIRVIDYEYTHDYSNKTNVRSEAIMHSDREAKMELGWSTKWHTGGDLNQILGILSEYTKFPPKYKQYIRQHVLIRDIVLRTNRPQNAQRFVRKNVKFPYATTKANRFFNPDLLLKTWFDK